MKFTQAVAIVSLVASSEAAALPSPDNVKDSVIVKRSPLCQNPGAHYCAVITTSSVSSLGLPASTVSGGGVSIVNGDCQSILAGGSLKTNNPGFSADFTTAYGTHLYYGADSIGIGNMHNIRFQYNGQSYTQGANCFYLSTNQLGYAAEAAQCNFAC